MAEAKRPNIAPIWRRALAFLIDLALVEVFLVMPFWGLIKKSASGQSVADIMAFLAAHPKAVVSLNMVTLFLTMMVMAYFVVLEYAMGQTVGMLLLRLRVRSLHNHIHWWQLVIRHLFLIPMFPFVLFLVAEPLSLVWTRGESRLLERLSKTRTVMA